MTETSLFFDLSMSFKYYGEFEDESTSVDNVDEYRETGYILYLYVG